MRPAVSRLITTYEGKVEFLILDYDNGELGEYRIRYRIDAHPAFAVVGPDGVLVANFLGPVEDNLLEEAIRKTLS